MPSNSRRAATVRVGAKKRGVARKIPHECPTPLNNEWIDPPGFAEALRLHLARYQESYLLLHRAVIRPGETFDPATIKGWCSGKRTPRSTGSLEMLARIEARYVLPKGYFRAKLPHQARAPAGLNLEGTSRAEQRRLAWHLPDDFNDRPLAERGEILNWVRTVVISGATEYRRYQAEASKNRYGLCFPSLTGRKPQQNSAKLSEDERAAYHDDDALLSNKIAPPGLTAEITQLIRFKSATLTDIGFQRSGVWNEETTAMRLEHLGLMFGAMVASPKGPIDGLGIPMRHLTLAMLVIPRLWDWYVQWREKRRGFFTRWEVDMLRNGMAFTRQETGWLRQMSSLADRLVPIEGIVTEDEIDVLRADWSAACDRLHAHGSARAKEIERVARVHRDPFEPILPVLEADSPVGEYRKIADEILRLAPDADRHPRAAAEAARSFLLIRLGLHLGLRQKNLRQLLVCPRDRTPRTERQLEILKRGEIRWSDRDSGWEVFIPAVAFKNAGSSFFGGRPFRLVLPDLGDLKRHIDHYVRRHRDVLLGGAEDPGTLFVKTAKVTSRDAAYDSNTFYEAWRLVIQRYGIFNPYTGRGAIAGLLPHGPHNIRDVLATHILKQTGSFERASYAIQDTPEMVAKHYGRFLPQDKSALAAQILNQVWMAA
jgi:integrase